MDNDGRDRIEWRLRRILKCYEEARSVGDFKDTVLSVQTALEDVIDLELGPEAKDWPFSQKCLQLFPDLYDKYKIEELDRQRNHYAHPKRIFEEGETWETAHSFVELTIQVWPQLFHTRVPSVSFPPTAEARAASPPVSHSKSIFERPASFLARLLAAWQKRQAAPHRPYTPFFRLPWLSLLVGAGLLAVALVLAGLIEYSITHRFRGVWYWTAFPAVLWLACVYCAARGFWRFLRNLGFLRLVVGLAGGMLVAVLALALWMPSSQNWGIRLTGAAVQVLDGTRQAGVEAVSYPVGWGERIAREALSPLISRLRVQEAAGRNTRITGFLPHILYHKYPFAIFPDILERLQFRRTQFI